MIDSSAAVWLKCTIPTFLIISVSHELTALLWNRCSVLFPLRHQKSFCKIQLCPDCGVFHFLHFSVSLSFLCFWGETLLPSGLFWNHCCCLVEEEMKTTGEHRMYPNKSNPIILGDYSRIYTVSDPPGLSDGHVWPMYFKNTHGDDRIQTSSWISNVIGKGSK